MGKRGPLPAHKSTPAGRLGRSGARPEPDADLTPEELAEFNRVLKQAGGHLTVADSGTLNLLARQLAEQRDLRRRMDGIDSATAPNDYLGFRRALTSLQGGISNNQRALGLSPKARASIIELKPLAPVASDTDGLPFRNDSGLSDAKVAILADVTWSGITLDAAMAEMAKSGEELPSLVELCLNQHRDAWVARLMISAVDDSPQPNEKQAALIQRIAEKHQPKK